MRMQMMPSMATASSSRATSSKLPAATPRFSRKRTGRAGA